MIKTKINYKIKRMPIMDFSISKLYGDVISNDLKCNTIYNFKVENGVLKKGMGVGHLKTYVSNDSSSLQFKIDFSKLGLLHFNKVMYFKQYFPDSGNTTHRLLFHCSDGKLYLYQMFSNLASPNWTYELQFDNIPAVLEYKKDGLDSILISAKDKLVVWSTGRTPYEISGIPTITSMCVCNDVLYCTIAGESDKILYTSNLDPESFGTANNDARYIIMEGSTGDGRHILKLKENMYVFCDYGIGRINTYANDEPTYNQIYLTNSQIRAKSVVVCGDFVMFLTKDGLYKFNGTSVTKIDVLDTMIKNGSTENSVAAGLNQHYYFALVTKFPDNIGVGCEFNNIYVNNVVVKLNVNDYSFDVLRGVDVKDMLALKAGVDEKIILTFNSLYPDVVGQINEDAKYFDSGFLSGYYSAEISPENFSPITIRKIKISAVGVGYVTFVVGDNRYSFSIKNSYEEILTAIHCDKFRFEIQSQDEVFDVKSFEIEYVKNKHY